MLRLLLLLFLRLRPTANAIAIINAIAIATSLDVAAAVATVVAVVTVVFVVVVPPELRGVYPQHFRGEGVEKTFREDGSHHLPRRVGYRRGLDSFH